MDIALHRPRAAGSSSFLERPLSSPRAPSPARIFLSSFLRLAGDACRRLACVAAPAAMQSDADVLDQPSESAAVGPASPTHTANEQNALPPPPAGSLHDHLEATPKFALRSDGAVVMALDDDLATRDLSERPVWKGVVLRPDEARFVLARLVHGEQDAASALAGRFPKRPS